DSQRSSSYGPGGRSYSQRRASQESSSPNEGQHQPISHNLPSSSLALGRHSTPPQPSYAPLAPVVESCSPQSQPSEQTLGLGGHEPEFGQQHSIPANTGYEPPSYEPEIPPSDLHEGRPTEVPPIDDDDGDGDADANLVARA